MKKLCLIRHAKSSWDNPLLSDFERPLNTRGYNDAHLMSKILKEKNLYPDMILSSPAKRAKETITIISEELSINKDKISFDERLYDSNIQNYFYTIYEKVPDNIKTLFLVAHNPTITEFANIIDPNFKEAFKTTSIVCFELNINSWQKLTNRSGKAKFHIYPKMFK